jgi:hypothetical protein
MRVRDVDSFGRAWTLAVFVAVVAATVRCGGSPTAPAGVTGETLELRLSTAHFRLFADRTSAATVQSAADSLERQYARVLNDLNVASLGPISVRIWQDDASYYAVLDRYFGVHYQATGYITGKDELRVLAVPQLDVNVVHEFCHAVSLSVSSTFANNPRWLWETLALYENGELVQPQTLDYFVRGAYPTLAALNADPNAGRQIYELGYVIGEFIVARWGRAGLLDLVRANGDLTAVFGVTPAAFEAEMYGWIRAKYL